MLIKQNLVPESKYPTKCPYPMVPEGICVHNTANDAPSKNEIAYMISNDLKNSFHFSVDDIEIWQGLPLDRNGWHAGDGVNGLGNRKHIAVEICYSKSGGEKFDKAEDNAAALIAQIVNQRGWSISQVKKHQDFSGKYCPHRTLDLGWDRFINKVKANMADMYKGIDLSNRESVKVAVDTWYELVVENKYLKKEEAERLLNELKNLYEAKLSEVNSEKQKLADILKSVSILLKLPDTATSIVILEELKKLTDAANQPVPPIGTPGEQLPLIIEGNGRQLEIAEVIYKVKN